MSYLVLARKYRPQRFEEIVAQDHVTRTLQNAVKNDRVGSGYLFCGPRGTGKTTTARVLAKALNCVDGPTPTPCGKCPACREIAAGTSLDVLEIDAASNTGVDDIRTLRENVRYLPTSGKKRVYIIDEVHRLSGPAFDALLKTLEEPPPHVIFMLATTEPLKVPETILSRTQRFDLKRVSASALTTHLKTISEKENLDIEEAVFTLLARKADGSVRDALSLLDQIAAFAGQKITEKEAVVALGLVDRQSLFDFTQAVASQDSRKVLRLTKQYIEAGIDVKDFVVELMEHFRILLFLTTDKEASDLLDFTNEELSDYTQQAENFSVGDIVRLMKIGADLNGDLKSGLDEQLVLEVAAVKMAQLEATVRFEDILEYLKQTPPGNNAPTNLFGQVEKKKNEVSHLKSVKTVTNDGKTPQSQPPYHRGFPPRTVNLAVVREGWPKLLAFLKQKNGMLSSQMSMTEVHQVKDNQILAVFDATGTAAKQVVERPDNLSLITNCLQEHFEAGLSIRFEIDSGKQPAILETSKKTNSKEDVKKLIENSPRIRMLIEKTDGEIIGIRKRK